DLRGIGDDGRRVRLPRDCTGEVDVGAGCDKTAAATHDAIAYLKARSQIDDSIPTQHERGRTVGDPRCDERQQRSTRRDVAGACIDAVHGADKRGSRHEVADPPYAQLHCPGGHHAVDPIHVGLSAIDYRELCRETICYDRNRFPNITLASSRRAFELAVYMFQNNPQQTGFLWSPVTEGRFSMFIQSCPIIRRASVVLITCSIATIMSVVASAQQPATSAPPASTAPA